ncbi:hypothetical protein OSTOST_14713 [Ostertagia ostertagi]
MDGWVSERLIRASIAAPFEPDPPVKLSPYEADEMLKDAATSGADCHRVGSVTEQLMSVARKMQAKDVQEEQRNASKEAQERSWLWTPQPESAESPSPGIAQPPQSEEAKTDNSSWDDVQITGTKWQWEVEEDEGKMVSETGGGD